MAKQFCPKCKRTMEESQFYQYRDGKKMETCKKCLTMHIDNFNPETFLWLLEKADVPYIPHEWNTLRDREYKKTVEKGTQLTGMSIFGRYIGKMKLKQYQDYSWADTERLAEEAEKKTLQAAAAGKIEAPDILKEKFDAGEITEAEYLTLSEEPMAPPPGTMYPTNHPGFLEIGADFGADLTEDDKIYLAMKWGRYYTGEQWVRLEKMYTDMHESFDIQSAAREDTLLKLCKTSLKMDEAIDSSDIDVYQKLSRVYDALSKAGKFTEAQVKEDGKGYVNSIGELVAICESELGFIPHYCTDVPQDIVDKTLQDMNNYTYNLVTKDMGLGQQIEDALKKIEQQRELDEQEETVLELGLEEIEKQVLEDIDYEEFYEELETQRTMDDALTEFLGMDEAEANGT